MAAVALVACASSAFAQAVVLYSNDFETPNVPLTLTCGNSLDHRGINFLYGEPGFVYNQQNTVEALMISDPSGLYSDPQQANGSYAIGMLSSFQNDKLALTFDSHGLPFINVGLDLSAIDVQGCGGPFGVGTPVMAVSLLDTPGGAFSWSSPVLDQAQITGTPSSQWVFDWSYGTADLDATGSTDGWITVVFDMQGSGYAAFDNLSIVAASAAGVVDTDTDGVADDTDNCPTDDNADQSNIDADLAGDVCDPAPTNPAACGDRDLDGVDDCGGDDDDDTIANDVDNCPLTPNTDQADADGDALGDACDACVGSDPSGDTDADGICDDIDACAGDDASGDTDADGLCDDSDACPLDPANDADGDAVCGDIDLCSGNDASGDTDGDGICDDNDACRGDNVTGDVDGDGICNDLDLCAGNDASGDTDGDGICDADDQCAGNDASGDSDGDGICDDSDVCSGNDASGDTDGDGICDDSDTCPLDALNDEDADGVCADADACAGDDSTGDSDNVCDDQDLCQGNDATGDQDADGVCDDLDNCPGDANADQADADNDQIGDACETDADGDGTDDDVDNCQNLPNPDQSDADSDGFGDPCDADDDNDGVDDASDNCPLHANPGQSDGNGDGVGDACDGDDDADGVPDDVDLCPGTPIDVLFDAEGCSAMQRVELKCGVPSDYGWKQFRYVSCVAHATKTAQRMGLMTRRERARAIRRAAWSSWQSYRKTLCRSW